MKSCSPCVVLSILPIAFLLTLCGCSSTSKIFHHLLNHFRKDNINFSGEAQSLKQEYGDFEDSLKTELKEKVREIFFRGYTNYYEHAYPLDELNPVDCLGRGPDYADPSNININDVLGNFSLTLIDSLDAIAIIGTKEEFHAAVRDVIAIVNFDQDSVVQVFEANIRVLGSLLSAHLLLTVDVGIGNLTLSGYELELLDLAHDLGVRLIQAFENSPTGLPFPRVNLRHGVPENWSTENCLAAAGSLLIEFGLLSRLVGDPDFEWKARRANTALWEMRSNATGLLGNTFDVLTGQWNSRLSGLGAGMDSFYEYLLKSFILFGEPSDLAMFEESYRTIKKYMRKGRNSCFDSGEPPLYVNVNLDTGTTQTTWVDALQASFPAVQVLYGDIAEAVCLHAFYHGVWKKYGLMPERYNWQLNAPDVFFYPLRPEFVESTYFLYQATKHPYYLHVGKEILWSLENHTKCKCGYCTVHDVRDKSHEDRMESFFLSETCKYLYLLFDEEHPVNRQSHRFLFTTEGHIVPLLDYPKPWLPLEQSSPTNFSSAFVPSSKCSYPTEMNHRSLPMEAEHFVQLFKALNVDI